MFINTTKRRMFHHRYLYAFSLENVIWKQADMINFLISIWGSITYINFVIWTIKSRNFYNCISHNLINKIMLTESSSNYGQHLLTLIQIKWFPEEVITRKFMILQTSKILLLIKLCMKSHWYTWDKCGIFGQQMLTESCPNLEKLKVECFLKTFCIYSQFISPTHRNIYLLKVLRRNTFLTTFSTGYMWAVLF